MISARSPAPVRPAASQLAVLRPARRSTGACTGGGRRDVRGAVGPALLDLALSGEQAGLVALALKPVLSVFELLMIVRIVMSWDPKLNSDKRLPWSLAFVPTEPVLAPTRNLIKPIGGVDIAPIIWTFILSLLSEILLGPQGILVLIERQGGL